MDVLAIDIETYSSIDLGKQGLYKYVESSDFEVLLFGYKLNNGEVTVVDLTKDKLSENLIQRLYDANTLKTAYNASFEYNCLNKLLHSYGYQDDMPIESWEDTMLLSAYAGFGGSLEKTAEALGIDQHKDEAGKRLIKEFSTPNKPSKRWPYTRIRPTDDPINWERYKAYNKQDVIVESAIRYEIGSQIEIPESEKQGWILDQKIMKEGILIDTELVEAALELDEEDKQKLKKEIIEITGIQNPKSNAQIKAWLSTQLEREVESINKEAVPALLLECKDRGKEKAVRVLELRSELEKTSLAKYRAIDRMICKDNRVRGMLQFYGSRTGRWAGRGVQVQNLPRNYLPAISSARTLLKHKDTEGMYLIYGTNFSDVASQLIRTSFIPAPGKTFAVADYSAIEARVIAWLSGESWRLDVFRNKGGKIYEASAAQMFGVDFDRICDKNDPAHKLRAQGKVAELALGYQGSVGALARMDYNNAIPEEDRQSIVDQWREKSPHIVKLWELCEGAALKAFDNPDTSYSVNNKIVFRYEYYAFPVLVVTLPSGRSLHYPYPQIGQNRWGKRSLTFKGINQTTRKLERIETYGGKLVENCLAGGTKVVTKRGLVRLDMIRDDDQVWDGSKWVNHEGLIYKGKQSVLNVDGVYMTPDHKIYTQKGWKNASSCQGYNRYEVESPYGSELCGIKWQKIFMEYTMRLWERVRHAGRRISQRQTKIVRLYDQTINIRSQFYPQTFQTPNVPCLAFNESSLYSANCASMEKLWGTRNQSLRALARKFRKLLGRHVPNVSTGFNARPNRCKRRLLSGKLSLGGLQNTSRKQTKHPHYRYAPGQNDGCRSLGKIGNKKDYSTIQGQSQGPDKYVVRETRREKPVYDLKNCGDKHCFTVVSDNGLMLVHNCVQAIARDCLAESLLKLDKHGYKIKFHVHDEIIVEVDEENAQKELQNIIDLMCEPPTWAPDLPLNAAGFTSPFYMKD